MGLRRNLPRPAFSPALGSCQWDCSGVSCMALVSAIVECDACVYLKSDLEYWWRRRGSTLTELQPGSGMPDSNNGKSSINGANPKILLDPYMDWAKDEGVPIHLDFGHDLLALET